MIESTPFITPADPLPQTTTSIITNQVPVVTSQIVSTPVVAPQVSMAPQVSAVVPQVSMVPQAAVSMVPQAAVSMVPQATVVSQPQKPAYSGVKVVPIYDDF